MWYKALHVISVIAWMAAILYMPRLFVYHSQVAVGSESDKIFQIMEQKLLRIIMNPAMIVTYISGGVIAYIYGLAALGGWFHIKLTCVILMSIFHAMLAKYRKNFINGNNKHSAKFYRWINEVPTILMIIIVIMVVVKPFE